MALFVTVVLLSIPPTVAYGRWSARETTGDGTIVLQDAEFGRIRSFLWAEVCVIAFIPLCAALMANGL